MNGSFTGTLIAGSSALLLECIKESRQKISHAERSYHNVCYKQMNEAVHDDGSAVKHCQHFNAENLNTMSLTSHQDFPIGKDY